MNILTYGHTEFQTNRLLTPFSTHQAFLHWGRAILGQEQSLGEPPSQERRRRRKKTHRCIYRKMRPHNTLFGERIIKERRCAGACVPVFWLTLCEQAGPRMNQEWDAGLTRWHTETALAFDTHSLLMRTLLQVDSGRMGQCSEVATHSVWLWVVGGWWSGDSFCYIWEERLDISLLTGHLRFDIQDEEVFAKQKGQVLFSAEQTGLSISI